MTLRQSGMAKRSKLTPGTVEHFLEKCQPTATCTLWLGGHGDHGYGTCGSRPTKLAHRVAYELFVGPIPADMEIDHLCRNRGCVNPHHLEAVTHAENTRRANPPITGLEQNWADRRAITHCPAGHEYTAENTRYTPKGHRRCRACHRGWERERHRLNAAMKRGTCE